MKLENIAQSNIKTFFLFSVSSASLLGLKLLFLWVFELFYSAKMAYAISHFFIFFFAYALHCKVTFKNEYSWKSFVNFFKAVILIKLADYFLFIILLNFYSNSVVVAIFVTILIFLARYLALQLYVFCKK